MKIKDSDPSNAGVVIETPCQYSCLNECCHVVADDCNSFSKRSDLGALVHVCRGSFRS